VQAFIESQVELTAVVLDSYTLLVKKPFNYNAGNRLCTREEKPVDRREFLTRGSAAAGLAAVTILSDARSVRAAPANERIALAVVGVRSRGHSLATAFAQRKDCRVAYLCDADSSLLASRADSVKKVQGAAPQCLQDFRKALDQKSLDAVVIATPDHWHCLATTWACQAGKDVFVAAPLGQNAWEGRRTVEVARRHKRIVQVDLASRSAGYCRSAKRYIDQGKLGKIHLCRVFEQKGQSNFPAKPDTAAPSGLDWDAWNGPAPAAAYNVNYQNNWQGFWGYSGGAMAVDGIHQLDLARWLCGLDYPTTVYASGRRLNGPGANETPDTLVAVYEFGRLTMTFELTLFTPYMTKISTAVRNGDLFPYWPQSGSRIEIYGSEGLMMVGPLGAGWQVFVRPRREQPIHVDHGYGRPLDADHQQDFIDSIRKRTPPAADVEEAHRSTLLVHYANMSLRTGGQKLRIEPKTEQVADNEEAMKLFKRDYRHPWVLED
jgi:predicted dehydrogenase